MTKATSAPRGGVTGGSRPERVFGLDVLRSVAVLMVVVAHVRFLLRPLAPSLQALSIFGYLGVELFFVLSGFLIGGIILKSFGDAPGGRTLTTFWVRRWFRTLPNYYLYLGINVLVHLAELRALGASWTYALFLQNLTWPCPNFFNESWSLTIEEWFYLLFPLLLLLASRLRRDRRFAVLAALVVLFALSTGARVAAVSTGHPSWDAGIRKIVVYRFDALMIGVLGACGKAFRPALWDRLRPAGLVAGTLLFGLVFCLYFALDRNSSFVARTLLFTLTSVSVLLLLPVLDAWREAGGAVAAAVRNVSLWSYSLYLCHLPVHHVLTSAFGDPERLGAAMGAPRILSLTAAFVVLSLVISALTYRFFERPAMNLRERLGG